MAFSLWYVIMNISYEFCNRFIAGYSGHGDGSPVPLPAERKAAVFPMQDVQYGYGACVIMNI